MTYGHLGLSLAPGKASSTNTYVLGVGIVSTNYHARIHGQIAGKQSTQVARRDAKNVNDVEVFDLLPHFSR